MDNPLDDRTLPERCLDVVKYSVVQRAADEWTFKMNMVMRASDDFVTNLTAIDRKAKAAEIVTSLFALEAILLIVWSATF